MPSQQSQQKIYGVNSLPGIFRDYTVNSSPGYTDGQYCRFYHGRPKKIGGWQELGSIGLSPQLTYYTTNGKAYGEGGYNSVAFGAIRAIKMYPISESYIVIVAADVLNVDENVLKAYNPNTEIIPSGLFIGITDNTLSLDIQFYPIRFQQYNLYDPETETFVPTNFLPGAHIWHITFFGTSSGGNGNPNPLNATVNSSPLESMGLAVHAEHTLDDKMNTTNSYVYFAKLSDLINFGDITNYILDPNLASATVAPGTPVYEDPRYYFSPMIYPMTSDPIGGVTTNPDNPYQFPVPVDPKAIYCTDEIYVSGGVTAVGPFLYAYGNNGLVRSSGSNNPSLWFNLGNTYFNSNPGDANDANIDNYKVVHAIPVRGGAGTSALCWTSNSLWLVQYTGAPGTFYSYFNISNSVSILSANAVIEQNGIFYWIGEDNFYMYSGAVQVMPNKHNFIWFYENLNYSQRAKTWAFKNPRFSELWWVFPKGASREPNWALVFNYQENFWYDTPWHRTAGTYDQAFYEPLCCGDRVTQNFPLSYVGNFILPDGTVEQNIVIVGNPYNLPRYNIIYNTRPIWVHERGYNQVTFVGEDAIDGFIITCDIGFANGNPAAKGFEGITNNAFIARIDPDSQLVGEQYIQVIPREYPLSPDINLPENVRTYRDTGEFYLTFSNTQGRIIRLKYGANEINSTFYLGKPLVIADIGDTR